MNGIDSDLTPDCSLTRHCLEYELYGRRVGDCWYVFRPPFFTDWCLMDIFLRIGSISVGTWIFEGSV
jgi:hypothetical protein